MTTYNPVNNQSSVVRSIAQLQARIAAATGEPTEIRIAPGTYTLGTGSIEINTDNIRIEGYGAKITHSGANPAIDINNNPLPVRDVKIRGLTIEGVLGNGGTGVKVGNTSNASVILEDLLIKTDDTGLNLHNAQVTRISKSTIDDCGKGVIFPYNVGLVTTDTHLTDCRIINNSEEGVLMNQGWGVHFTRCQIENNGYEAIKIDQTGGVRMVAIDKCWIEINNVSALANERAQLTIIAPIPGVSFVEDIAITNTHFAVHGANHRNIALVGKVTPLFMDNIRHEEVAGPSITHGYILTALNSDLYSRITGESAYWATGEYRAFTSGSVEISPGDTVVGDISGQTALVAFVALDGGSWAGGDASGIIYTNEAPAGFQAETISIQGGASNVATIAADFVNCSATWK